MSALTLDMAYDARDIWRRRIFRAPGLPSSARLVALSLAQCVDADGIGAVGVTEIAGVTGYHRTTVMRALTLLLDRRWLRRTFRGRRSGPQGRVSTWQLADPAVVDNGPKVASGDAGGVPRVASGDPGTFPRSHSATLAAVPKVASSDPGTSQGRIERPWEVPKVASGDSSSRRGEEEGEESSPSPSTAGAGGARGAAAEEQLVDERAVQAVVAAVPERLRPRKRPEHRRLQRVIRQHLHAGVQVHVLVEALEEAGEEEARMRRRREEVHSRIGFLLHHLREAAQAAEEDEQHGAASGPALPPHCGVCDPNDRTVELYDGRVARCQACNPHRQLAGASL